MVSQEGGLAPDSVVLNTCLDVPNVHTFGVIAGASPPSSLSTHLPGKPTFLTEHVHNTKTEFKLIIIQSNAMLSAHS